ncbi:MAG: shikimate kinase, partial [Proteobacteria bacterium]|nr:shikimate kinase [Pseudomonadota bacterium]
APQNRAMIAERGCSVWLKADVEVLWQRLRGCTDRPLLQEKDGLATLRALAKSREIDYAKADITITAQADWDEKDVAGRVLAALLASSKIKEIL